MLPQEEKKRIVESSNAFATCENNEVIFFNGERNFSYQAGAIAEASLWFERMGKFAESSKQIVIDGVWWTYRNNGVWVCKMVVNGHLVKKSCTTHELVELLLKENKQP